MDNHLEDTNNVIHLDFSKPANVKPITSIPMSEIEISVLTQRHIQASRDAGFKSAVLYVGTNQLRTVLLALRQNCDSLLAGYPEPLTFHGVEVIKVNRLNHYHFVPLPTPGR